MKKQMLILIITLMCSCSGSFIRKDATIKFAENKHDFGKILLKNEAVYSFEFLNTGKSPLVIYDVKTSCGCTIPEWTKAPVQIGKTGNVTVRYDASYPGEFHKSIVVKNNGPDSPVKLEIGGEVEEELKITN
jgi:hypothetical protein